MKQANQAIITAAFEVLEDRFMMSAVSLEAGVLSLQGNADTPNEITVKLNASGTRVYGRVNDEVKRFRASQIKSISITGGDAGDYISVNRNFTAPAVIDAGASVGNRERWRRDDL